MVIRGGNASLARSRAIRSAMRNRRSRVLNRSLRNTSSRLNNSSKTQSTAQTQQTKKLAMYEDVQKAADDLQKTAKELLELGKADAVKEDSTAKSTETVAADSSQTNSATTTEETTATENSAAKAKAEEEQKEDIIDCVKDLVEQYNELYESLEDIGGSVNTLFASQLKKLIEEHEKGLEKVGVSMNRNGTLSITKKTLEGAELNTLKGVFCTDNGLTAKLMEKCDYIESNAASTIDVMNRMYGTQTYNRYGTSSSYYGSNGSWYNAIG